MKTFEEWLKDNFSDVIDLWQKEQNQQVKPEEEKWIVYLNRTIKLDSRGCYLTACREDRWESVQKDYGAKIKLFVGAENEVTEWYRARQKFAEVIKAWEDRREIQLKSSAGGWYPASNPDWNPAIEYRIKPQIGQIELITTTNPLQERDGWYFCDGRKLPKEFIGNKAVEEVVNTYGTPGSMRLPDKRPANCAIYLGESKVGRIKSSKKKWKLTRMLMSLLKTIKKDSCLV